jgi:uncharacterized protein YjbK
MVPVENEIKLDLQSEDNYRKLIDCFAEVESEDRLDNYFFDTDDRALSKSGWALRIRRERGGARITAKGAAQTNSGGLTARPEIETPLPDDDLAALIETGLEISRLPAEIGGHLGEIIARKSLEVIATFTTWRTSARHRTGDLELKFEIDRTVFPGGTTDYELEVELPDAAQFDRAMKSIKAILSRLEIPVRFQRESKFARALKRIEHGT